MAENFGLVMRLQGPIPEGQRAVFAFSRLDRVVAIALQKFCRGDSMG